jgi:pentatricopeptide repeat protein
MSKFVPEIGDPDAELEIKRLQGALKNQSFDKAWSIVKEMQTTFIRQN